MEYKAAVKWNDCALYAIFMLALIMPSWESSYLRWLSILFALVMLVFMFVSYRLHITDDTIVYEVRLFGKVVYKKCVTSADLNKIVFKRSNWMAKSAIIFTKRGFNIRVIQFTPEKIYTELFHFCARNDTAYEKTKEYKIVEKMAK